MKRFAKPTLFMVLGIACGVPLGQLLVDRDSDDVKAMQNPDAMNLTLPRDFFAQLPKSADGQHRLVSVDTFTFTGEGESTFEPGTQIVLPRFDLAEMPDSYRERFMQLQR